MHTRSQIETDLIDLDSPPPTKAIHTQPIPNHIQPTLIPTPPEHEPQPQPQPPRTSRKSKRGRAKRYLQDVSLGALDIVLEEVYDPATNEYNAIHTTKPETLAEEDTSLEQNGNFLAGWVCNIGSPASSPRCSLRRTLSASSSMDRPYVQWEGSNGSSSDDRDDGGDSSHPSIVSGMLGSIIPSEEGEDGILRSLSRYSDITIRSSLLSTSPSEEEENKPSQRVLSNTGESVSPPYIKPTYRRSYEIPIVFSVGDEVFLISPDHGNSISWISPKKPREDGGLLSLDNHNGFLRREEENWFRKCNVYLISKIHVFQDPSTLIKGEEVYELIPDVGDDGHVRVPMVSKGDLMAVKFKPGDRVRVSRNENRGGLGGYNGTVGLAWVEGGQRMYQVMPSGLRGFRRPAEESMRQIEDRHRRWDVASKARGKGSCVRSIGKEERDRYMTTLLRNEKMGRTKGKV